MLLLRSMWCLNCKKLSDSLLCPACSAELAASSFRSLYHDRCEICHQPLLAQGYRCDYCNFSILAYGPYRGVLKHLIQRYKSGGELLLFIFIASLYHELLRTLSPVLLIPIPASRQGKRNRGYDQITVICRWLCFTSSYRMVSLFTQQSREMQKYKDRRQRLGAKRLHILKKRNGRIQSYLDKGYQAVIIDDVMTTGSTMQEAQLLFEKCFGQKPILVVLSGM